MKSLPAAAALAGLIVSAATFAEAPTPAEILESSIAATGGFETFARLRAVEIEMVSKSRGGEQVRLLSSARLPHRMVRRRSGPGGTRVVAYDGGRVSLVSGSDEVAAGADAARDARSRYWRDWWILYARYAWHGLGEVWIDALEPRTVGEEEYHALRVRPRDANEFELLIHAESHRPAAVTFTAGGEAVTRFFDEFRNFDGILLPTRITTAGTGTKPETLRIDAVRATYDTQPLTLERRLDAILRASIDEKRIPGLSAIVAQGDGVILEKSYGMADTALGVAATAESVFPLASVSKPFAATIAMRLVEDGLLDLDASIASYLDDVPPRHADVTTRHLLSHTHGLEDALSDNPGRGLPISGEEQGSRQSRMQEVFQNAAKFEPGAGWAYSISGYEILQAILENVTGLNYERLAEREIFEGLKLESAKFGGSDRVVPGRPAMDYVRTSDGLAYNYLNYPEAIYTSAGLNATARDVFRFFRAVAKAEIIEPSSRDEMWCEVVLENGEATYYGLGWGSFRTTVDDRFSVGHSGGGSSWTRYFPESDVTVIVLSNLNGARADKLVYDLATAVEQADRAGLFGVR